MKPVKIWIARDKIGRGSFIYTDKPVCDKDGIYWSEDRPTLSPDVKLRPGQCQQFEIRRVKERRK